MDHLKEFINRATELLKDACEANSKEYREIRRLRMDKYNNENRQKVRENHRIYSKTEKGKYAVSLSRYRRRTYYKIAKKELSWKERKLIGNFYKNCPAGYEVDHITPIAKGGLHILSNLQYLTKEENRKKGAKLNWKKN